jgi:hypothetical protein
MIVLGHVIDFDTHECGIKACPEAKGSSPTTGLLIVRLVT